MPPILRSGQYELDFADLYERMWALAVDDRSDGTRLYRPSPHQSLKWIVAEFSGAPASVGRVSRANINIRRQVEKVLRDNGWGEIFNDRGFRLLRLPAREGFDWPTIEWVKEPIRLITGDPSGSAIRMRHFLDCKHWYREEGTGRVRGGPPQLASGAQMEELRPCGTCVARARVAGHKPVGPRVASNDEGPDASTADPDPDLETDSTQLVAVRREQAYLRRYLVGDREQAPCAICDRILPTSLLVAAHIAPRRVLSDPDRLDYASAAMLACTLGCDSLFEHGYVVVDGTGSLVPQRQPETAATATAIDTLVGRRPAAFNSATAPRFRLHRVIHGNRLTK